MRIRFDDPLFEAWTQHFLFTMAEGGCEIGEIKATAERTCQSRIRPRSRSLRERRGAVRSADGPGYDPVRRNNSARLILLGRAGRRPLIIGTNGYDETVHIMHYGHAVAAQRRGYHVLIFDGPGQGCVRIGRWSSARWSISR
jgi:hypothetical protein